MENRDFYLEKISVLLEQYSAKIALMHCNADEIRADMKLEYLNQVDKLEVNRDGLKEKYEQLRKASESYCGDMKGKTENAWNELKDPVAKATEHFKWECK